MEIQIVLLIAICVLLFLIYKRDNTILDNILIKSKDKDLSNDLIKPYIDNDSIEPIYKDIIIYGKKDLELLTY